MITGNVSPFPKNSYLRWGGRDFSSNFEASCIDGFAGGDSRLFISNSYFFGLNRTSPRSRAATNDSYSSMQSLSKFIIIAANASTPRRSSICFSDVSPVLYDIADTDSSSSLYLMDLQMLKVTSSLFNWNFICPFSISTKALPVARNGLQRIVGTSKSTSQSRITKSAGNMNDYTFTRTSWSIPIGLFTVRSDISSHIVVGFGSPNPYFL